MTIPFAKKPGRLSLFILISALIVACGPAARQSVVQAPPPSARDIQLNELIRAADAFQDSSYQRAIVILDSLLPLLAPTDSQLVYLSVYYGIKARLSAEAEQQGIESFLERHANGIAQSQQSELRNLLSAAEISQQQAHHPATAYKIGAILPLSGKFFEFGEAILEGVRLAIDEFNALNSGQSLELEVHDDAGDPVRAAQFAREFAADSTVAAILGSHGNDVSLSLALVSAAENIPLVCPTADAPGLDAMGNTIYVLNRTDPRLSFTVADASVNMLGLHTFAVLSEDDARGTLLADGFVEQVMAVGGAIVADLRFPNESSDFEDNMAIIQRYLPDAIYFTSKSDKITQLASQVHYYGMGDVKLLGGEYWDSERVIRLGADYVDGSVFATPFHKDSDQLRWSEFKQQYENSYRRPVNRFSGYGYDAAGLVLSGIESLPASRAALAETLRLGNEYKGATGIYSVGDDGKVDRHYFMLQLDSGNIVPARQAPAAADSLGARSVEPVQPEPSAISPN